MINQENNDLYDLNEALKVENLTFNDYEEICKRLKRKPNRTELGMFGVMWSEHCCYRNSKPLLSKFPTKGKNVLVGPGENAGVIDVGNNQKLVFKIESHNHPSAIEPFQGAATGVGGILRDIFTMGARPIAVLNSLRFGNLDKSSNVDLLRGVVSGIAHYGNCVGVPTVGGEIDFDDSYSGNPLVNVMALGLLETDEIVCSGAKNVGSPVLYVGNTTGRDGVGGASFASSELTTNSLDDRPAVQVGDPFIEKSQTEVIKLKNNFYDYFFELIVEIIKLLSISKNELNKRFTFSNINVIKQALKKNKSVIVVVGHYGNWEWALRSASNLIDTKIIGVYKRINNTIFEWLLLKIRSNTNVLPVEIKSLTRELVNNNEKKIYAMVADQSPTLEQSNVRINFLNRDTLVYTGVEKISKKYNMPVFYLNIKLTSKGYYESTFEEINSKNMNGKKLEITKEFFSKLENQIKSEPRLWLWSHKRWKHTN